MDQQIAVWDVAGAAPSVVLKHSIAAVVLSLAWNPAANELTAGLTDGTLLVWAGVVPGHMVEPHVALPEAAFVPGELRARWHAAHSHPAPFPSFFFR